MVNTYLKEDLTGRVFGRLTVVQFAKTEKGRSSFWVCRCTCGIEKVVNRNQLTHKSEPTRSCGCLQKENIFKKHGLCKSKVYKVWTAMKQRCFNSQNPEFANYGYRGISVCSRWLKFENFLKDMGHPLGGLSIERKNNNQGYNKHNCKWASTSEQMVNRRNTIQLQGKPLRTWCRQFDFKYGVALARFHRGLSFVQIFKPYTKRKRRRNGS